MVFLESCATLKKCGRSIRKDIEKAKQSIEFFKEASYRKIGLASQSVMYIHTHKHTYSKIVLKNI